MGLGETFASPVPFEPNDQFRIIALNADATYEEVYLAGLETVQYNFLLTDRSFYQIGWSGEERVRYAYYPNPFIGASDEAFAELNDMREYVEEGLLTEEDYLHRIADLRYSGHPPLTRYENASDQYNKFSHPCSHLHLGHHSDNRWPVRRVLTPEAFCLFTMKLY